MRDRLRRGGRPLRRLGDIIGVGKAAYSVPDDQVAATLDVTPWLETKVAAVLAHRGEVKRGALPGLIAGMARDDRATLLGTEWYLRAGAQSPGRPDRSRAQSLDLRHAERVRRRTCEEGAPSGGIFTRRDVGSDPPNG